MDKAKLSTVGDLSFDDQMLSIRLGDGDAVSSFLEGFRQIWRL